MFSHLYDNLQLKVQNMNTLRLFQISDFKKSALYNPANFKNPTFVMWSTLSYTYGLILDQISES